MKQALRAALAQSTEAFEVVLRSALVYENPEAGRWWWSVTLTSNGATQVLLVHPDDQQPAAVGEMVSRAVRGELLMALCCVCKRMRVKDGSWHRRKLSKDLLHVTHGICPECATRLYPAVTLRLEKKKCPS